MSWSVRVAGKPEKVVEFLESYSEQLTGVCRDEYDDAKPHLVGIVKQNFMTEKYAKVYGYAPPLIRIEACGTGGCLNGDGPQSYRSATVKIEQVWDQILV